MCWDEAREERWGRRLHWPVIASHVCQLWRQYALDTPAFWAQILFDKSAPRMEKYHEWFARLKNATFDVYISWQPFTAASVKHAKAIMRLIMPHISHLRSLCVGYVPLKILRVILNRLSVRTPRHSRSWASMWSEVAPTRFQNRFGRKQNSNYSTVGKYRASKKSS